MPDRRRFLQSAGLAAASMLVVPAITRAAVPAAGGDAVRARIAAAADFATLEAAAQGRLGVAVLDAGSGRHLGGHRPEERFPMCSTFKAMLSAAVLAQADRGALSLDERLPVGEADIVSHSPVTRRHVGKDVTVRDLCRATMTTSDNGAANLLLGRIGGTAGLTAFLRGIGDRVTRSDRMEPEMNAFAPGDPRDTTSPRAMAGSLARCVLGDVLSPASRMQLADWLVDNGTGDDCLRAGIGPGWRVGDKTGGDGAGTRNDIAVAWPLGQGSPWVVTAYLQGAKVDSPSRDAVLARAGALAAQLVAGR
ncbi:Beta-lactamase [Pseudoxanthomonas suwonensis 11-1]|uniref:Beta-lactamase n=1 Tax=Pseudoxanthomonas suwonensis (strain 11-1) TaxID=743721 RepID=E6WQI7_PSEUU|nr:class A beta-lactamase [Pseudoxanthomonas suwonensis]ADV26436.1 Beta-lactamase [Pseudoxanthomonas suwonensis 11-1]